MIRSCCYVKTVNAVVILWMHALAYTVFLLYKELPATRYASYTIRGLVAATAEQGQSRLKEEAVEHSKLC